MDSDQFTDNQSNLRLGRPGKCGFQTCRHREQEPSKPCWMHSGASPGSKGASELQMPNPLKTIGRT